MDFLSLELNRGGNSGDSVPQAATGLGDLTEQLQTLIRGIALHSIEGEPEDFSKLQHEMAEIAQSLTAESSADDTLVAISKTLRTLDAYNRKAASLFKNQATELRGMIATVTETLQFIVASSDTSVKQLGFVEAQLQKAQGLDDLRQLKTYTASCLNLVKRESERLQVESKTKVEALKQDVERLKVRLKAAAVEESHDPVTDLPARAAAEQAMESRISAGKPYLAALFCMDRLATINGKFGHDVGDDIVMSCAQMLAKKMSGATLYRWSGPSFLAVFDPLVPIADAESRARQAAAQQLEKNITIGERTLLVVVGVSCHLQPVSAQTDPHDLFRQLDSAMIAGQG
jgi:diguanylate cyclase (GGDEF)-like protein